MTNVHACLVHEAPDCVRDLVANLRHLDPQSTVLLYDGSADQSLLRSGVVREDDGVLVHPRPRGMRWGTLHDFAFDALHFALDHTDLTTLTVVDSDQLALRPGYAGVLAAALADRPRAGCLVGTNGGLQPRHTRVGPALAAWREIERWRPFLRRFPDGEALFPHWGFWPAMVFTRPAAESVLELAEDRQLRDLLAGTRMWATEEVVLPTLVALTGHQVLPNPTATDYVRYRVAYTPPQLERALTRPDAFWIHPVPRRIADPLRVRIRRHHGDYLDATAPTPSPHAPATRPTGHVLLRTLPLFARLPTLPGRLSPADADLLLGAAVEALRQGPGPHTILSVGLPCARRAFVLDTAIAAVDPAATRTTSDGPADLVVLDAAGLAEAATDWTEVEGQLHPGALVVGIGGGRQLADLLVELSLAEAVTSEAGSRAVRFREPLAAPPLRALLSTSAGIDGWLDPGEAVLLAAATARALAAVPGGTVVEVGSYCGRGTVVLGAVAVARGAHRVVAVDTFDGTVGAAGPQLRRGPPTFDTFRCTLRDAGLADAVDVVRGRAPELAWDEPVALAVIDGLHDHASVLDDAERFIAFVPPGGMLAFHDYADYWPGVGTAVAEIIRRGGWRRVARVGSLLVLQRVDPAPAQLPATVPIRPRIVAMATTPSPALVTCVMPTRNRPEFVPRAVESFLQQDYPEGELLVVDDGPRPVGELLPDDPRVRYLRLEGRQSVGAKRNAACARARGELVLHWDDDDWYAPWRIRYQVEQFLEADADVAGLATLLYWDPAAGLAWRYRYPPVGRPWVHDPTFCYRRSYWERHPFPHVSHDLDTTWLWRGAAPRRVLAHEDTGFYVGIVHPGNTSPKRMTGPWWERRPVDEVLDLVGGAVLHEVGGVAG